MCVCMWRNKRRFTYSAVSKSEKGKDKQKKKGTSTTWQRRILCLRTQCVDLTHAITTFKKGGEDYF